MEHHKGTTLADLLYWWVFVFGLRRGKQHPASKRPASWQDTATYVRSFGAIRENCTEAGIPVDHESWFVAISTPTVCIRSLSIRKITIRYVPANPSISARFVESHSVRVFARPVRTMMSSLPGRFFQIAKGYTS
jgi:hypothetical protein